MDAGRVEVGLSRLVDASVGSVECSLVVFFCGWDFTLVGGRFIIVLHSAGCVTSTACPSSALISPQSLHLTSIVVMR